MQAFLEEVMEEEMVLDGTIAQDTTQVAGIWGIREGISVALKHAGAPLFVNLHPCCCPAETKRRPDVIDPRRCAIKSPP